MRFFPKFEYHCVAYRRPPLVYQLFNHIKAQKKALEIAAALRDLREVDVN